MTALITVTSLSNVELVLMPSPTGRHADIVDFLYKQLDREVSRLGLDWVVRPRNVGVRTTEVKSRLLDVVVITEAQRQALRNVSAVLQSPSPLVVEIVSSGRLLTIVSSALSMPC